jgi:polyferredoxin
LKNITLRRAGQWGLVLFLAFFWVRGIFFKDSFFDFEACCPFGGLQAIATFFTNGALACSMDGMQVIMGSMLALSVILVSKLFCGYVCPVGTISEGLGRLGKRFKLPKYEIGGISDMLLRSLKYILLFIVFYFTLGSNELFCKKFDPLFATVSLYGEDVTAWMATLAIVLLVAGALFFRQFWCRYLCPLGAISSAFKYFYVFVAFAAILIILNQADVNIDLVIILAILAFLAYMLEIIGLRKDTGFQLLRITRNTDTCIDCGICDKKCPQGIKVSELKVVNHPDCNLCTECMGQCPNDIDAIGLNGSTKFRWLPALITIAFVMAGFIFGANTTIPTVDMKWGDSEAMEHSAVFEMAGIKNVKCYGSSITFVNEMKAIPGITGAATFIRDHRVRILYDSTKLSANDVRRSLFTPEFLDIRTPANDDEVRMVDFYVENFFDKLDMVFIANLAKDIDGIFSFKTYYGEPVRIRFYINKEVNTDSLKMAIENSDLVYVTPEESFSSKDLYKVTKVAESDTLLSGNYLKSLSFPSFSRTFNNRSQYSNDQLASLVFPITKYPRNQQLMPYLLNHLGTANPYVVGLISRYSNSGPIAVVFYVKEKTSPESVIDEMMKEKITIKYDNGIIEQVINPYSFDLPSDYSTKDNKKTEEY